MNNIEANQAPAIAPAATAEVQPSVNSNVQVGGSALTAPVEAEAAPVAQPTPAQAPDFLSSLAEDIRGQKALANFKTADDLAKSYLHAQQLLGKRIQELSPEDAAYYNSLRGVPKDTAQYTLPEEGNPEMLQWYKQTALQAGLTQDQAKAVFDQYVMLERSKVEERNQASIDAMTKAKADLKAEFGAGANNQIKLAADAIRNFGGDDVFKAFEESGLGNNTGVIKMLAKIGQALMEDKVVEADKSTVFGMTPEMAQREINLKMNDPEFKKAYFSNLHPQHKEAVEAMSRLYHHLNTKQ